MLVMLFRSLNVVCSIKQQLLVWLELVKSLLIPESHSANQDWIFLSCLIPAASDIRSQESTVLLNQCWIRPHVGHAAPASHNSTHSLDQYPLSHPKWSWLVAPMEWVYIYILLCYVHICIAFYCDLIYYHIIIYQFISCYVTSSYPIILHHVMSYHVMSYCIVSNIICISSDHIVLIRIISYVKVIVKSSCQPAISFQARRKLQGALTIE